MKIVINNAFGGFHLSDEAIRRYKMLCKTGYVPDVYGDELDRTDPLLVRVVEELGDKASDRPGDLIIVDIPAGAQYRIRNYDGSENIEFASAVKWETAR